MNFLHKLDLFGIEAKWRLFRRDKFNTKFSGFVSMLFCVYIIIKFFILIIRFISKSDYSVSFSESGLRDDEAVNIKDFEIAFCIKDKSSESFVSLSDNFSISSLYISHDEFNKKLSETQAVELLKCTSIQENSIHFRRNFLKEQDLNLLSYCLCAYPDPAKFHSPNRFELKSNSLHGAKNSLSFRIKLKSDLIISSKFSLNVLLKDYSLNTPQAAESEGPNRKISHQVLGERISAFNFELENLFLKKVNFFLNEIFYSEKVNMEFYDRQLYANRKYAIADKREENTLIKYSDLNAANSRLEVLELNFLSNQKRVFYSVSFFGLNQLYIELSANVLLIFVLLRFFMQIYNQKNWDLFLDEVLEKRFANHCKGKKKLEAFFNVNYFSNLEKEGEEKEQNFKQYYEGKKVFRDSKHGESQSAKGDYASFANEIKNRVKEKGIERLHELENNPCEEKGFNSDVTFKVQGDVRNMDNISDEGKKLNPYLNVDNIYNGNDMNNLVVKESVNLEDLEINYPESQRNQKVYLTSENLSENTSTNKVRNKTKNLINEDSENMAKINSDNKPNEANQYSIQVGGSNEKTEINASLGKNNNNIGDFIDLPPLEFENINQMENDNAAYKETEQELIQNVITDDNKPPKNKKPKKFNHKKSKLPNTNFSQTNFLITESLKSTITESDSNIDAELRLKAPKSATSHLNPSSMKNSKTIVAAVAPKVCGLETVQIKERNDVRKSIKGIFAVPKSRNQLLKDFMFRKVLDIDTYTNALMEFYKLQKILLSKDLLVLFKKISFCSIFEEKNFSYYNHSINSYFYPDSKLYMSYDKENFFDNYVFESLKKECFPEALGDNKSKS